MSRRLLVRAALTTGAAACLGLIPAASALGWSSGGHCDTWSYGGECAAPAISLVKLEREGASGAFTHGPLTGNVGDTIEYQMTVANTGNTPLAITFSDPQCDPGTLSGPAVLSGIYDADHKAVSAGGELQYTCSHVLIAGNAPQYTNTATVAGQPPKGSPVSASSGVVTLVSVPGMTVGKLEREGSTGAFSAGPIAAVVGESIDYAIQISNTGNTPLALSLSDPLCDAGTIEGPTSLSGTLSVNVLSPGGEAQYTCSHVLTSGDASPFTNTATVTGQPPTGPAITGAGSVTATKQAIKSATVARCGSGKVKKTKKVHGKKVTVCVAKKRSVISRKATTKSGFTG